MEIISALNLNNTSRLCFDYYGVSLPKYRPYHYNPQLYMNSLNSIAFHWNANTEDGTPPTYNDWPESFGEKYNSPFHPTTKPHPMVI